MGANGVRIGHPIRRAGLSDSPKKSGIFLGIFLEFGGLLIDWFRLLGIIGDVTNVTRTNKRKGIKMMSIQESEEYDFYPASEFQNAYAISRMEMDHGDVQQINEHVAAGRFVVVESGYKYCQMTDACLGVANYLISVHETHEEAEAAIPADIECDGEIWFHVVPAVNSHPAVPVPTNDSDKEIPF